MVTAGKLPLYLFKLCLGREETHNLQGREGGGGEGGREGEGEGEKYWIQWNNNLITSQICQDTTWFSIFLLWGQIKLEGNDPTYFALKRCASWNFIVHDNFLEIKLEDVTFNLQLALTLKLLISGAGMLTSDQPVCATCKKYVWKSTLHTLKFSFNNHNINTCYVYM